MTPQQLRKLLAKVFPTRLVKNLQVLSGGLINTNIRVDFEANYEPVVIRLYRNGAEVCRKELALHDLLSRTIRVPRALHAEPDGIEDSPAFLISEYVDALTFQELKRTKDLKAIHHASHSVGATLAAISDFKFEKPGRIGALRRYKVPYDSLLEGTAPILNKNLRLSCNVAGDPAKPRRPVSDSSISELRKRCAIITMSVIV